MMTVGERLAKLRAAHGETLRQAATRTGVHYSTLARLERGETGSGSRRTLHKVASGYGVSLESLLQAEGDPFAAALAALTPFQRLELSLFADRRMRFALRYATTGPEGQGRTARIAAAAGLSVNRLSDLLSPASGPLPAELIAPLCAALVWEGGINAAWLRWGDPGTTPWAGDPAARLQAALLEQLGDRLRGAAGRH